MLDSYLVFISLTPMTGGSHKNFVMTTSSFAEQFHYAYTFVG